MMKHLKWAIVFCFVSRKLLKSAQLLETPCIFRLMGWW